MYDPKYWFGVNFYLIYFRHVMYFVYISIIFKFYYNVSLQAMLTSLTYPKY